MTKKDVPGSYYIKIDSIDDDFKSMESYILHDDGTATFYWMNSNLLDDLYKVNSEKTGTWEFEDDSISIYIQGNTEMITEKYLFNGKEFVNDLIPVRVLSKN